MLAAAAAVGGYAITSAARADAPPAAHPGAATERAARRRGPARAGPEPRPHRRLRRPALVAAPAERRYSAPRPLGPRLRARIVDLAQRRRRSTTAAATSPAAPASTAKLLDRRGRCSPCARPPTGSGPRVRAAPGGALVLVGGGDPTLTSAAAGPAGPLPGRRADQRPGRAGAPGRRCRSTRIVVDDGLFTGPTISPAWAPEDVPSDYGAGDHRRCSPTAAAPHRATASAAPPPTSPPARRWPRRWAGRACRSCAAAPRPARRLVASVSSAPLGTLVEQMMLESDNVIAECLARQVALAEQQPASFTGAAAAIRSVLRRVLGVDLGAGMVDASGLAAARPASARPRWSGVLRGAAARPRLRDVLTALPVAAWSGTLADRYVRADHARRGRLVRAKTGTLTGVSALAGTGARPPRRAAGVRARGRPRARHRRGRSGARRRRRPARRLRLLVALRPRASL